jgi:hypothetical protein
MGMSSSAIIIKLQKRVKAGAATLLIKVKAHRGDPLNEEADIRAKISLHRAPCKRVKGREVETEEIRCSGIGGSQCGVSVGQTSYRHIDMLQ